MITHSFSKSFSA